MKKFLFAATLILCLTANAEPCFKGYLACKAAGGDIDACAEAYDACVLDLYGMTFPE